MSKVYQHQLAIMISLTVQNVYLVRNTIIIQFLFAFDVCFMQHNLVDLVFKKLFLNRFEVSRKAQSVHCVGR